jgi:hypothetical protein
MNRTSPGIFKTQNPTPPLPAMLFRLNFFDAVAELVGSALLAGKL